MKKSFPLLIFLFTVLINDIMAQNEEAIWEKKANFEGGQIENAVAFSIGTNGYVCAGSSGLQYKKDVWKYNQNDVWEKMANFPGDPRISAVAFSIGNKGYVGTGQSGTDNQSGSKDFWEFDAESNQWTKKADLPAGIRYGAVGFSIGDKGYIALGASQTEFYNDLWEYNPKTDQWTKKADFPEEGRIDASAFVADNKAYVLLGAQQKNIVPKRKELWEYNPQNNKWTKKTDFPGSPRIGATGFSINNKGYIYGGFNRGKLRYQDVWEYNSATNSWSQKADALCGVRSYAFCFVINNSAFIGTGKKNMFGSNDFWQYGLPKAKNNENEFAIGASIYLGDQRMPMGAAEVQLLDKQNKVIQTTTTNIFGSFLFQSLSKTEDYTIHVVHDPYAAEQKIYMVNRNDKPIATLEKSNDFKYFSSASDIKTTLLKVDNSNMRMNVTGRLALSDAKKTPLKNTAVSLISSTQEVVQMTTTDENGSFTFTYLPLDSSLYVSFESEGLSSLPKESLILLMDDKANVIRKTNASNPSFHFFTLPPEKNTLSKMYMEDPWIEALYFTKSKCAGVALYVIENIYFESGKDIILIETKAILNKIVLTMKSNSNIIIEIDAHTDSRGTAETNMLLSGKRAVAAKQFLMKNGIEESRITAKGFGETKLLNKCADNIPCTEEEHALNRRIEFKINCKK